MSVETHCVEHLTKAISDSRKQAVLDVVFESTLVSGHAIALCLIVLVQAFILHRTSQEIAIAAISYTFGSVSTNLWIKARARRAV